MKIILFNGPPRSGKDFAAECVKGRRMKMAKRLKEMTHGALGLMDQFGRPLRHDFFEDRKDVPLADFRGATPRACYIQMSEGFIKPLYGEGALGMWLAEDIQRMAHKDAVFTVSDSGFRAEAEELVKVFGPEVLRLVRVHRDGYDYSGDSRGYIDLADLGVPCRDITNCGGSAFREQVNEAIS